MSFLRRAESREPKRVEAALRESVIFSQSMIEASADCVQSSIWMAGCCS